MKIAEKELVRDVLGFFFYRWIKRKIFLTFKHCVRFNIIGTRFVFVENEKQFPSEQQFRMNRTIETIFTIFS